MFKPLIRLILLAVSLAWGELAWGELVYPELACSELAEGPNCRRVEPSNGGLAADI